MSIRECGFDSFSRQLGAAALAQRRDAMGFQRRVSRWELLGRVALPLLAAGRFAKSLRRCPVGTARSSKDRALQPFDAPRLFAMLKEMHEVHGAPVVHELYLNDDLTAEARQLPMRRFWWIGSAARTGGRAGDGARVHNQLVIGRALLRALSVGELKAVIAHELGHFAGNHGQIAARFQRLYKNWSRVGDGCESFRRSPVSGAIARWYARRLLVLALPLYRRAELEADEFAGRIAGAPLVAQALVRLAVAQVRADEMLCADDGMIGSDAQPGARDHDSDFEILQQCLREDTQADDRHPCLRERLESLGITPHLPPVLTQSAESLVVTDQLL